MIFDEKTKKLINVLSAGIEPVGDPYRVAAEKAGIAESEALELIRTMIGDGTIRRNAAVIRQRRAGYSENAMCVFRVAPEFIETAGAFAAAVSSVSHCYERDSAPDWPYNFYAMVHGKSDGECERVARDIACAAHCDDYKLLRTVREYKKKNAEYFPA